MDEEFIDKDLENVRNIFLADDVDDETRQDNLQVLTAWENRLRENKAFVDWQRHDITSEVAKKAKEAYKELSLTLAKNRGLTEAQRQTLFAKQDAAIWLLSLIETDAEEMLQQTYKEIRQALTT